MKKYIRWTEEEVKKIAKEIASYLLNNPGATLPAAYKAVNGCLAKDRRRNLASAQNFEDMIPIIKGFMKEKRVESPELVEVRIEVPTKLEDFSLDDIYQEFFRRQFGMMVDQMALKVAHKVTSDLKQTEISQESDDKIKLPKVLVVGLLPKQQNELSKEFNGVYDLRFHKDESLQALKDKARNVDTVVMSRFINHAHQEAVRSIGVESTFIKGGLTEIKKYLEAKFMSSS